MKARKILAVSLTALCLFSCGLVVGRAMPAILPEFVASGCLVAVGVLIAFAMGYLVWPQDTKPKAQPLYGRRQPCSDTEAWERLLKTHAAELAELRCME